MADMAKEIVRTNGYSDVTTVLKGKVEEIELLVAHVDVIIFEWMGYFLLFENMLGKVLSAHDKWLINDGVILLDKALLFLTAIEDAEYNGLIPADSVLSHLKRFYCSIGTMFLLPVWNNVYGFDTSCIRKQAMAESLVDTFDSKEMVTSDVLVKTMDISEMASGDVSFTAPFKLIAEHDDYIHAFVAYFNVLFTQCHKEISFLPTQDQRLHTGNKMFSILMKF